MMRYLFIPFLLALFLLAGALPPAQAGYFTFEPNQFYEIQDIGDTLAVDLLFNPESDHVNDIESYTLWCSFDSSELMFKSGSYNLPGFGNIGGPLSAEGNLVKFYAGTFGQGYTFPQESFTSVLTLEFEVISAMADNQSDISLLSQIGTTGGSLQGMLGNDMVVHQYPGAEGPDIHAVPAPGPIWLLGSGLLGWIGWINAFQMSIPRRRGSRLF